MANLLMTHWLVGSLTELLVHGHSYDSYEAPALLKPSLGLGLENSRSFEGWKSCLDCFLEGLGLADVFPVLNVP